MRHSLIHRSTQIKKSPLLDRERTNLQAVREKILQATLNGALIFGILALLVVIPVRYKAGDLGLVGLYFLACIWLMVITFGRRLPYTFRTINLLCIDLLLGLVTIINDGVVGNGRIFLIVLPILAGTLVSGKVGFLVLAFTWGLVGGAGYLKVQGLFVDNQTDFNVALNQDSVQWVVAIAAFILVSGSIYSVINSMLRAMQHILEDEKELSADLEAERAQLERRVQLRTQELEHRLSQIRTASEISNHVSTIFDIQQLFTDVADMIKDGLNVDYVGIFSIHDTGQTAELIASSGDVEKQTLDPGYKIPLNANSLIGWSFINQKARIAMESDQNLFKANHLLPQARSEMAVPLIRNRMREQSLQSIEGNPGQSCLGAILVYSSRPMAFDTDDLAVIQSIANSLTTAIENANLFNQVKQNLDEIKLLNRQYLRDEWSRVQSSYGMLSYTTEAPSQTEDSKGNQSFTVPLVLREQVIGVLSLEKQVGEGEKFILSQDEQSLVHSVLKEAALALENIRLLEEAQRRAGNERLLSRISQMAQSSKNLESILRTSVQELGKGLGASEALIRLDIPEVDIKLDEKSV
jgi:GAF domain-containing protein